METTQQAATHIQLIVASITVGGSFLLAIIVGTLSVLRGVNQTNVRVDSLEKTSENDRRKVDKITMIESRVVSLEKHRSEQIPIQTQMIQMLASLDAKLDANAKAFQQMQQRFDRFDEEIKDLYKSQS